MRNIFLVSLVSIILIINGWRFISGEMVHLPILGTKDIQVPFKIDPNFEEALHYIRTLPEDGRILTLPLTDFGYQIVAGIEGGLYVGPSMIGYLTDKKDYTSYYGFDKNKLLLKFIKERNYNAVKNILAVHNIKYVYFNQDPFIFDSFSSFPYETTKEYLPTQDSYKELLRVLQVKKLYEKGSYQVYRLPEDSFSPLLYATNNVIQAKYLEDIEYMFRFYSFVPSQLAVIPGDDSDILRTEKIDIYSRLNKDYPFPIWYPFARWELDSPIYPLVLIKERNKIGCIKGYIDEDIDCDLFYSLKRVSEIKRWEGGISVIGNSPTRKDLLARNEPNLINLSMFSNYNSWEASLARYIRGIDKVVYFIENAKRDLGWKIEKKSKFVEILSDNQRILELVINNSTKSEKDKVYVEQLLESIFSFYLEKVKVVTFDPSQVEYVLSSNAKQPQVYEIFIKQNEKINPKDIVLSFENKEYRFVVDENDGWVRFEPIVVSPNESRVTLTIPRKNIANGSNWSVGNTIMLDPDNNHIDTVSKKTEGIITKVNNLSPGHHLLSFDYLTHGAPFDTGLFVFGKNKFAEMIPRQLFQELKLSNSWRKMNSVIEVTKPSDIVVQINPMVKASTVEVKNLSLVELPPHPEIILKKIDKSQKRSAPDIDYSRVNPTKYSLNVRNVSSSYTLIFSQAFNTKWNLIDTTQDDAHFISRVENSLGRIGYSIVRIFQINTPFLNEKTFETWGKHSIAKESHVVANGYANGWQIQPRDMEETNYTLILEMTSQRTLYYYILFLISALPAGILLIVAVQLASRFKIDRKSAMITQVFWKFTYFIYKLLNPKRAWEFAMSPPVQFIFKIIIKLFGDRRFTIKTKYGFNMILTVEEYLVGGFLHLGETNPFETHVLRKILRKEDVFFDVGAYKGWYAFNAAQMVGKNGRVFAFEPNGEVVKILDSIKNINRFKNINIEAVAVSDKNGTSRFWTGDKDMLGSLIKKHIQTYSDTSVKSVEMQTVTLDSFVKQKKLTKVKMIKVDVEGADLNVLKGAKNILETISPYLLVEVFGLSADINNSRKNEILDYLARFGYKPYQFVANGLQAFSKTQKDSQLINLFFAKKDQELKALKLLS